MKIAGALTAQWFTLEYRDTPDDVKNDDDIWLGVEERFASPEDAMAVTAEYTEAGQQCRIVLHRLISTEMMRFS